MNHDKLVQSVSATLIVLKSSRSLDEGSRLVLQDMFLKGRNQRYLNDDDFAYGVKLAHDALDDYEDGETLTLQEVIKEIELNLSWAQYNKERRIAEHFGWSQCSYAYHVGFTYEWMRLLLEHEMITDLADFLPDDGPQGNTSALPMAA